MQRLVSKAITNIGRTFALALFVVYCLWNLFWICQWRIPPSLFLAFTSLPCPTTGCTRSVVSLLNGDVVESWRWNPLTIPIIVLFCATLGCLVCRAAARKPLLLPGKFLTAWGGLLGLAWACKLLGNPSYW
ncbi:MAG: DUF2752 domain-containing protein [Pirellulales bacterium]